MLAVQADLIVSFDTRTVRPPQGRHCERETGHHSRRADGYLEELPLVPRSLDLSRLRFERIAADEPVLERNCY